MRQGPASLALLLGAAFLGACGPESSPEKLESLEAWRQAQSANAPADLSPRLAAADLELGAALYTRHCLACHGVGYRGDGPGGFGLQPRPTDLLAEARQHPAADLYADIARGLSGSAMVAWQGQLNDDQIIAVIAHLRAQVKDPHP